jgi:plasmid stability protein
MGGAKAMATLTVKNIPDDLYDQLRRSATEARRSLNSEILYRLEASVRSRRLDPEEVLARARAVRKTVGHPVTEEDLRRARSEGRP